ncbi:NAD(P)H-dependent oxidoreductase [Sphingopyxis sp. JAI108]|uniref:NAD(P)H-dependent oxidoreductase n=1 Tax=Sphingopyxis sp. JAI108 TaxID=2723060 RepID=UPI0015CDADB4|nr:FMN-dependent NADH-azoreductase [Sphingopyxis sp. JAI108]
MRHILVVNSSISGEISVSRLLVDHAVKCLVEAYPDATVTFRDVGNNPIPHLVAESVAGVRGVANTAAERATRAMSDELIAELRQADLIVIGAPMYNFSIPTSLRAWFDHVLRPRVTFAYGDSGAQGLVEGKRAIVIEPRGGVYSEGPACAIDFQEPYLRQLLGFIGISEVAFVHAEKIGYGPEVRDLALANAKKQIADIVEGIDTPLDNSVSPAVPPPAAAPDFENIMMANLSRVFGERDASRRILAIREIYAEDATLYEPDQSAHGHEAISQAVTDLLSQLPPDFAFKAVRPAQGHNGVGRLQWQGRSRDGSVAVSGLDVAHIEAGLIRSLHVFLDQPGR